MTGRQRAQVLDHGFDCTFAVACRARSGEAVVAERTTAPIAAARGIVRQQQLGRQIATERQPVEIRGRKAAQIDRGRTGQIACAQGSIGQHEVSNAGQFVRACVPIAQSATE